MAYRKYDPTRADSQAIIKQIQKNSKKVFPYNDRKQPAFNCTIARICYTLAYLKSIVDVKTTYSTSVQNMLIDQELARFLKHLPSERDQIATHTLKEEYVFKLHVLKELTQTPRGLKDAIIITQSMKKA